MNEVAVFLVVNASAAAARSVFQKPSLLILDEATSALDYLTERQVCLNLKRIFSHSTVFFITHRLSTIRAADLILMMDSVAWSRKVSLDLLDLQGRYLLFIPAESTLPDTSSSRLLI